jgi:hypothetical protein
MKTLLIYFSVWDHARLNFAKDISLPLLDLFVDNDTFGVKKHSQALKNAQSTIFEYFIDETNDYLSELHKSDNKVRIN